MIQKVRRSMLDARVPEISLLTYGSHTFNRLMDAAGVAETELVNGLFRLGDATIGTLEELEGALDLR